MQQQLLEAAKDKKEVTSHDLGILYNIFANYSCLLREKRPFNYE